MSVTGSPASWARYSALIATRKPASVLPEPVGAAIRVSTPDAMSGHPSAWGSEGPSGKRRSNQVRTAGWKSARPRGAAPTLARSAGPTGVAMLVISSTTPPILARTCDS